MKFSGKMCLKIILKVTKNQGFSLSLEDTLFEKPQGGGVKLIPPSRVRVNPMDRCTNPLHKKKEFYIKNFFSKCDQVTCGFGHVTEEISNGKLFFCAEDLSVF